MGILALISFLSLWFLITLIKIFYKLWRVPYRLQRLMSLQGIKGPPYRFLHGSTKEIKSFHEEAMSKPFGLSHNIYPRIQPHTLRWTNSYGTCYLQWFGSQPELVVTEPKLIKEILSNRERLFEKMDPEPFMKKILGDGLTVSKGEKWAKMRKLANHAFHGGGLKGMFPTMVTCVEEMLERWDGQQGSEFDVYEEFRFMASELISRTAFGSSYLEGKAVFEILEKLTSIASRNLYNQSFSGIRKIYKSRDEREAEKLEKEIHNSIVRIIMKREEKEKIGEGDGDRFGSDFLGELIRLHRDADEARRISVEEMVDECKTFYFAGQETTNALLAWTVLLLATHTDWQEIARKEALELFGKRNPTPEGISKLNYMSMIINETLRLYPPVVSLLRRVEKEVRLGSINLPAKIDIEIPILALHHDPDIWGSEVHVFKPERFAEGVAKATNDNIASFLPFGMGPRVCVGFNFAISEAKIALVMILQRYAFTLSPAYVHSPVPHLAVRPQHGLQVILNRF